MSEQYCNARLQARKGKWHEQGRYIQSNYRSLCSTSQVKVKSLARHNHMFEGSKTCCALLVSINRWRKYTIPLLRLSYYYIRALWPDVRQPRCQYSRYVITTLCLALANVFITMGVDIIGNKAVGRRSIDSACGAYRPEGLMDKYRQEHQTVAPRGISKSSGTVCHDHGVRQFYAPSRIKRGPIRH